MKPSSGNDSLCRLRTATCLETDEDVMRALRANFGPGAAPAFQPLAPAAISPTAMPAGPHLAAAGPGMLLPNLPRAAIPVPITAVPGTNEVVSTRSSARLYCPIIRPPLAVLTVFDDGKTDGEQIRLRGGKFLIGRTEGHLKLSHDAQVSSRHLEIVQQEVDGRRLWVINDLNSTNGLYGRVSRAALLDKAEFLIGQGYYRLAYPSLSTALTADYVPSDEKRNKTHAFGGKEPTTSLHPTLIELIKGAVHAQMMLTRPEYWIGTDPSCAVGRPNDPFCEPRHAHLFRDTHGMWHVENNLSVNGVWVRVPQLVVEATVQFQIGEQRFKLQVGA
jgi:hypothetical protein